MIRIAFGSVPKDGGTFTFYRNMRDAFLQRGIDIKCVSVGREQAKLTEPAFVDQGCVQLAPRSDNLKTQAKSFADWCVEAKIDIVFGVNSPAILSALPHLPQHIRAFARCANGFDEGYRLTLIGQERLARIVALVPRLRDDLVARYGVDPARIAMIPNGTSSERFEEAASVARGTNDILTLGFLGRLEHEQKGVLHLPKILDRLDALGTAYRLRIAGKGVHENELRACMAERVAAGSVEFVGSLTPDEIPPFLSKTDIFLFPSHFEGCPNALLEAMAAGTVSLGWRLPGITDFILDAGQTGYLADVGDTDAFANIVADLDQNRTKLGAIGKAAAHAARDRFSIETCAAAYDALFATVAKEELPDWTPRPWSAFSPDPMFRRHPIARFVPQSQRRALRSVLSRISKSDDLQKPNSSRVYQIINSVKPERGGAERLALQLHNKLLENGFDAHLLAIEQSDISGLKNAESLGVTSPYDPRAVARLARYARRISREDIVHVHLFPSSAYNAALSRLGLLKGRLLFTEHSTSNRRRDNMIGRLVDTSVYRSYDRVIAISEGVKNELVATQPWLDERMAVIGNGCPLYFADRPSRKNHDDAIQIVSVGRLSAAKNYGAALRAFKDLPPKSSHYKIAGEGPERASVETNVAELGLQDSVDLLGYVEGIPELLSSSDIFLIPSAWEGFGLAAVEAMNAGLPIVASDVPGLREVVGPDGEAAILVDPNDPATIRDALQRLIDDPELRQALGARGFERAKRFDVKRFVDAHVEEYSGLGARFMHAS